MTSTSGGRFCENNDTLVAPISSILLAMKEIRYIDCKAKAELVNNIIGRFGNSVLTVSNICYRSFFIHSTAKMKYSKKKLSTILFFIYFALSNTNVLFCILIINSIRFVVKLTEISDSHYS